VVFIMIVDSPYNQLDEGGRKVAVARLRVLKVLAALCVAATLQACASAPIESLNVAAAGDALAQAAAGSTSGEAHAGRRDDLVAQARALSSGQGNAKSSDEQMVAALFARRTNAGVQSARMEAAALAQPGGPVGAAESAALSQEEMLKRLRALSAAARENESRESGRAPDNVMQRLRELSEAKKRRTVAPESFGVLPTHLSMAPLEQPLTPEFAGLVKDRVADVN
jgi:hypothetical protein